MKDNCQFSHTHRQDVRRYLIFFICHIHFIHLHVKENGRLRGASEGASRGPASTSPNPVRNKSHPWLQFHAVVGAARPAHPMASVTSAPRPFPVRGSLSPPVSGAAYRNTSFPIRPLAALRVAWGRPRSVSPEPFRHCRIPRVPRGVPVRMPGTVRMAGMRPGTCRRGEIPLRNGEPDGTGAESVGLRVRSPPWRPFSFRLPRFPCVPRGRP